MTRTECPIQSNRSTKKWTRLAKFAAVCGLGYALASHPIANVSGQDFDPNQNVVNREASAQQQIMAVVNGESISRQQIADECLRRFGKDVLGSIIKKMLVLNECQRRNIVITEKDVNDDITAKAKAMGFSTEHYVELICTQRNITLDQYKNDIIWQGLALRRLAAEQIQVSQQEIQNQIEFEYGPKVQVREIVFKTRAEADQILPVVQANPEEFGNMAKRFSANPNSQAMNGLLPPIARHSGDPDLENIIFAMQPGQVSDVLAISESQFVILKCERIYPGVELTPADSMKIQERIIADISEAKLSSAATTLFEQLESTAQVANVMNDPELARQMPGVAATVDNKQITIRLLAEECIARFAHEMLESEIDRTLMNQALKNASQQVTQDDLSAEVNEAAEAFGYVKPNGQVDIDAWLKYVTNNDLSKVDFYIEDEVWRSAALKKLVSQEIRVSDEDLQKGFEANFGPRVEVLAIVMKDHREALRVWTMANNNPSAEFFGKLANQYSVEPASQANFGEVPPIARHSSNPELESEAFNLSVGEISRVVTVGEYHFIIMCTGQTTPVVDDINSVRDTLMSDLRRKKTNLAMQDAYIAMRENSQIDNYLTGTSQASLSQREAARAARTVDR
ncbi:MAG: peptidylprolyl isomerase [Pirellulaceae bacterium]